MATNAFMDKKFLQNRKHCESVIRIGKSLFELILSVSDPRHVHIKDKLGVSEADLTKYFSADELEKLLECDVSLLYKLEELDFLLLYKLVHLLCHLEEKDPDLQNYLQNLKNCYNNIAHTQDNTKFTDFFIWQKIEELRILFIEILGRINNLYSVDINDKSREININIDKISKRAEVVVSELDAAELMNQLNTGIKCPCNVKVEIKEDPRYCAEIDEVLRKLCQEDTRIKLLINKAYFVGFELKIYNSKKHLLPLLEESSRCQLVWYRGNMSDEMFCMLPSTLEQLYVRVRPNQLDHLTVQFPKLIKLWSLGIYLDFSDPSETDPYNMLTIDPSALPVLQYKGKQLGIRIGGCLTINNISWIVTVIKKLTQEHQCDTLEFYRTRLNTGHEIEALLLALNEAEVHITTWVKLQNMEDKDVNRKDEENRLSTMAENLSLKKFQFLAPWKL